MRFRKETPAGRVHTAAVPDANRAIILRYGVKDDPAGTFGTNIRARASRANVTQNAPDTLIVASDIHGEYDRFTAVLRNAGIIDAQGRWSGGRKHLAILGDVFDRGGDAIRTVWMLYRLEEEAARAGGRLHFVLGNHEAMVMTGDLRYLSAKDSQIATLYDTAFSALFDPRHSVLGQWLASKPVAMRVGDILLAHGGVSGVYARWTLRAIDDTLRRYVGEELFPRWADRTYRAPLDSAAYVRRFNFFWDERSIFWYRGYARFDSTLTELKTVLDRFDAAFHVVGHTPGQGIRASHGGLLVDVNTMPFAAEALMLVRRGREWERYRIRESGPPEPL